MIIKKIISAIALICTFFLIAQPSFAESSSSKKYAPYIGYEHAYTSLYNWDGKIDTQYTPRIFTGIHPMQGYNYKIGTEIGYTLPVTYSSRDGERYKTDYVVQGADIYLTYYRKLGNNFHWFLKPGIEYHHESIRDSRSYSSYMMIRRLDSIYVAARAGAGYNLNNKLAINLVAGSRFYDFMGWDSKPVRFLFNINAEYAF